ncbi:MAG: sugar ABC transporter ATP-binding protein [Phyllobacteriaceae bacterium]|nr:sugar ABC transporter ATP-binding protein [Phyllobacteriaceae bacterium]
MQALQNVDLDLHAGEVHAIMGENGAGKSSLIKAIVGAITCDSGEIRVDGTPVSINTPADAQTLGIAAIHQELSLVPHLSIAQNVFLGREPMTGVPFMVDHRKMADDAAAILHDIGLDCDVGAKADSLKVAHQQVVEIAKALSQNARVLILDEPTASLSDREADALFAMIDRLRAKGTAIVYISHRMNEIGRLADRITVLRDGKRVLSATPSEISTDEIIVAMVGRPVAQPSKEGRADRPVGDAVLELEDVWTGTGLAGITMSIRAGEIVGLAGLVGSGRTEVARAIFGVDPVLAGRIDWMGAPLTGDTPERVKSGIALVPEDRKEQGLCLEQTISQNLLHASFWKVFPKRLFRPSRARSISRDSIAKLRVATPHGEKRVGLLSGGNQQKTVIGKWLNADARLFIFDEPTRGIDIGAKAEIVDLMIALVERGNSVLMISSELPELVGCCDRVYVLREGEVAGELADADLTEDAILRLAMHHD